MHKQIRVGLMPLCITLFVFSALADQSLTPTGIAKGYLADAGRDKAPSAIAVAHAAGEFRVVAANVLWMNVVDHYHHQFMAQGGYWAKNKDLLPLLKMIVTLDPHFTQAYGVDMEILCELNRYPEAEVILSSGIRYNPQDWQMDYDMAMLHAWFEKDPSAALPYAEKAYSLTTDSFYKRRLELFCSTIKRDIKDRQARKSPPSAIPAGARTA